MRTQNNLPKMHISHAKPSFIDAFVAYSSVGEARCDGVSAYLCVNMSGEPYFVWHEVSGAWVW